MVDLTQKERDLAEAKLKEERTLDEAKQEKELASIRSEIKVFVDRRKVLIDKQNKTGEEVAQIRALTTTINDLSKIERLILDRPTKRFERKQAILKRGTPVKEVDTSKNFVRDPKTKLFVKKTSTRGKEILRSQLREKVTTGIETRVQTGRKDITIRTQSQPTFEAPVRERRRLIREELERPPVAQTSLTAKQINQLFGEVGITSAKQLFPTQMLASFDTIKGREGQVFRPIAPSDISRINFEAGFLPSRKETEKPTGFEELPITQSILKGVRSDISTVLDRDETFFNRFVSAQRGGAGLVSAGLTSVIEPFIPTGIQDSNIVFGGFRETGERLSIGGVTLPGTVSGLEFSFGVGLLAGRGLTARPPVRAFPKSAIGERFKAPRISEKGLLERGFVPEDVAKDLFGKPSELQAKLPEVGKQLTREQLFALGRGEELIRRIDPESLRLRVASAEQQAIAKRLQSLTFAERTRIGGGIGQTPSETLKVRSIPQQTTLFEEFKITTPKGTRIFKIPTIGKKGQQRLIPQPIGGFPSIELSRFTRNLFEAPGVPRSALSLKPVLNLALFPPVLRVSTGTRASLSQPVGFLEAPSIRIDQLPKQTPFQIESQKLIESQQRKQISAQLPATEQLLRSVQLSSLTTFQAPIQGVPSRIARPGVSKPLVEDEIPKSAFLLPLELELPKDKAKQGYDTFVRESKPKGGKQPKPFKVNKEPLPFNKARNLGGRIVDNSSARSFSIRKSGKTKQSDDFNFNNPFKFRQPKGTTKLKRNTYVEKSAFAIDTFGEINQISARGWIAQRKKARRLF